MRRVYQTRTAVPIDEPRPMSELGNCWNACVASVLGVELNEVPERGGLGVPAGDSWTEPGDWFEPIAPWLADIGMRMFTVPPWLVPEGYAIASGTSPRGTGHSVVVESGWLAHDPLRTADPRGLVSVGMFEVFVSATDPGWRFMIDETPYSIRAEDRRMFAGRHTLDEIELGAAPAEWLRSGPWWDAICGADPAMRGLEGVT